MAFKAGAITADALLNTSQWQRGIKTIGSTSKGATQILGTLAKVGFGVVAAAMGVATFKTIAFEKEMRNVSTLLDDTPGQLEAMRQAIIDMDAEFGTSKDLASGLYQAISAGAKVGKEAMDVVTQSAMFARAALTDTNTAVDIITTAMNAYGKENISAAEASDLFFQTIKLGKITGQELSAVIGQSIPLFASVGIEMKELTAGLAAMTKQGIKGAEATTQMNAIVNAFLKPSAELSSALEDIGFESGAAFIEVEGLAGILEFLQKETKGEKSELAKLIPNIRGMKGAMALTGKGADIFTESLEAMGDVTDSTTEAFKKQLDPIDTALKTFDKLAVIVGEAGKAFLDELAVAVTQTAKDMIEFFKKAETMEALKDMAKKLAGAIINLAKFVGGLVKIIIKLPAPLKSAVIVGTTLAILVPKLAIGFGILKTAVIAFNVSAMLGPTGMIVLVGAAIAVFIGLVKILSKAKKSISDVVTESTVKQLEAQKEALEALKISINKVTKATFDWDALDEKHKKVLKDTYGKSSVMFTGASNMGSVLVALTTVNRKLNEELEKTKENTIDLGDITTEVSDEIKNAIDKLNGSLESNKKKWDDWNEFVEKNLKTTFDKFEFWASNVLNLMNTLYSGLSNISTLYYQNEKDKLTISENERLGTLKTAYETDLENLTASTDEKLDILKTAYDTDTENLAKQFEDKIISEEEYNEKSKTLDNQYKIDKEIHQKNLNILDDQYEIDKEIHLDNLTTLTDSYESDKTDIEEDALKKRNDLAKKQFENQKTLSIAQIWINAASGIMSAFNPYIPVISEVMAGIVTTAAIAQTVLVGDQQFVPEYAEGTDFHMGGMAMVGEQGPEIVNLPTGSRVIPNDMSESMMSGHGKEIVININNPIVRQDSDINKIASAVSHVLGRQLKVA